MQNYTNGVSASRSPVGCTPTSSHAVTAAFEAWMQEQGIVANKCKLHYFEQTGRGVVATAHISPGDIVVEVPDSAVLMAETSSLEASLRSSGILKDDHDHDHHHDHAHHHDHDHDNKHHDCCGGDHHAHDDEDDGDEDEGSREEVQCKAEALIMAVMCEKARGEESPWHPYLAMLPAEFPGVPFLWEAEEQALLAGTSTHHLTSCKPAVDPPSFVKSLFKGMVHPFFASFPGHMPGVSREKLWELYCWATAAVAGYAFELGDESFHAMVPFWDMLNHVTGRTNVRLSHDAERGVLQMIATEEIAAGEEVVNSYGELSNGHLLRRYGFIEPCRITDTEVQALARIAQEMLGSVRAAAHTKASGAWRLWRVPNRHDAAVVPLAAVLQVMWPSRLLEKGPLLAAKLEFLHHFGIIPETNRYMVSADGKIQEELAETVRVLLLTGAAFRGLEASVLRWRAPMARPLASTSVRSCSSFVQQAWVAVLAETLALVRTRIQHPQVLLEAAKMDDGTTEQQRARARAAMCVSIGEWCALDHALERLTEAPCFVNCPQDLQESIRAAESSLGGNGSCEPEGAEWLWELSQGCWREVREGEAEAAAAIARSADGEAPCSHSHDKHDCCAAGALDSGEGHACGHTCSHDDRACAKKQKGSACCASGSENHTCSHGHAHRDKRRKTGQRSGT